ncbi:hypothetical protein BO70DRAFT_430517 [Aspergillus heteromorphus CBS 117.55]|uniref:Uncharacterized protein n=1 Tax=Aspergillus heteromorphus CBS 117.55 TaxID=1448321 RepID=A0A317VRH4_9EURO|nr:uncharacterized protein BO70DRAFT_430517 [Aspergillus heteromorphus CBS 117.55]PWY76994.1 hypothetical protein BO70DRAFT_430517 [Aspergillus heteromorphus CBS 117.55]
MYSQYTFWMMVLGLPTRALAQSVLNEVDSQDGNSDSTTKNRSVSPKGMIILCTIVALVLIIGVSFTTVFIVAKKRRLRARDTLCYPDGVTEVMETPSVSRTVTEGNEKLSKGSSHIGSQPDLEKNARTEKEDPDTRPKGWGTYFSFGRT